MTCSISPWFQDQADSSFTPELLLRPQSPAPQRMPLLSRRGHENTTGSSSRISKIRATPGHPPREISIVSYTQPESIAAPHNPDHYRIPLGDILLVDTMLASAASTEYHPDTYGSSGSHKLVLILPACALELDCVSRNSYDLVLACLEAFLKKSKIRKIKKKKNKNLAALFPESRTCPNTVTTTTTATATAPTTCMTTIASGNTSSHYTFTLPFTALAVRSNTSSAAAKDGTRTTAMSTENMFLYECSSVDALTDQMMYLAATSESLADKLGRRIGKAMADISETLLM
jgi:hypothetical protein